MGSLGHAVVVAGGWCRISANCASPTHMLDRLANYKQALMDEQRVVSAVALGVAVGCAASVSTVPCHTHAQLSHQLHQAPLDEEGVVGSEVFSRSSLW